MLLPCFSFAADNLATELQEIIARQQARTARLRSELLPYAHQADRIGRQAVMPQGDSPAVREMEGIRTVVFVSRAMPEADLLTLLRQGAGRSDIAFAFRGWGNGSMKEMFDYSYGLVRKLPRNLQKTPPHIIVHPKSFREYRITHVPAVAHRERDGRWYLIQGILTIDSTVEKIRRKEFGYRLSRQWKVTEPDQAEVMKRQVMEHDWKTEEGKAAAAVAAKLDGSISLPVHRETSRFAFTPMMAADYDIRHPATGRVVYPKGTRFNLLALDPKGRREFAVIDGSDRWQVDFVAHLRQKRPQMLVFYTRLGQLEASGIPAMPLDRYLQQKLRIAGVPSYYSQNGLHFDVYQIRPR